MALPTSASLTPTRPLLPLTMSPAAPRSRSSPRLPACGWWAAAQCGVSLSVLLRSWLSASLPVWTSLPSPKMTTML
ncbi:hypothetical protein ATCV1_z224L [Acanthocystis turfacea chlorella virus 1]|uniref:Uncharacterized protein z224L n=1 Tax=Chlorovirus heliozoae TaxID=322019 RepID=A7K8I4_9PHYC|nr:hypothetical protein ATCV1_z224L [Acanthocystis turfacea chlorella virus 1]ABT16358.1 hypothetical protein ATCV1_z224L [Acanthocystis turfacea chlorella virus 1]